MKKESSAITASKKDQQTASKLPEIKEIPSLMAKKRVLVGQRTAKGQPMEIFDDAADYEQVNVKAIEPAKKMTDKEYRVLQRKEEKDQLKRERERAAKKKEHVEPLLTPTWISVVTVMGLLTFGTGVFCGIGAYMLLRADHEATRYVRTGSTISSQCFEYLRNVDSSDQHCVFEKYSIGDGEGCNGLCSILHWRIETNANKDIVRFVESVSNVPTKFKTRRGTKCGYQLSCSKDGKCTEPMANKSDNEPVIPKQFKTAGRWILTCPEGVEQCLRFPTEKMEKTSFDEAQSKEAWNRMKEMSGCDTAAAEKHCKKHAGLIALVPRFQFRRCRVNVAYNARTLKCNGPPGVVNECFRCPKPVDNKSKADDYRKSKCGGKQPAVSPTHGQCVFRCTKDGGDESMPDGYPCWPRSGYCLLGHCYKVKNATFTQCNGK